MTNLVFYNFPVRGQASDLRRPPHHRLQSPLEIGLIQAVEQFPQIPSLSFGFAFGDFVGRMRRQPFEQSRLGFSFATTRNRRRMRDRMNPEQHILADRLRGHRENLGQLADQSSFGFVQSPSLAKPREEFESNFRIQSIPFCQWIGIGSSFRSVLAWRFHDGRFALGHPGALAGNGRLVVPIGCRFEQPQEQLDGFLPVRHGRDLSTSPSAFLRSVFAPDQKFSGGWDTAPARPAP